MADGSATVAARENVEERRAWEKVRERRILNPNCIEVLRL